MKLIEFANQACGGLVLNDRGNGSGGPRYIFESSIVCALEPPHDQALDWNKDVTPVTEEDDPEAWQLIREAFEALDIEGSPEAVALAVYDEGQNNPYTLILSK
jgi:hypothetical protein